METRFLAGDADAPDGEGTGDGELSEDDAAAAVGETASIGAADTAGGAGDLDVESSLLLLLVAAVVTAGADPS